MNRASSFQPVALLLAVLVCISSCSQDERKDEPLEQQPAADSISSKQNPVDSSTVFPPIQYKRIAIASKEQLDSLRQQFGKHDSTYLAYRALTTLNRKDIYYFRMGDTVVMPDTIVEDLRAYSVFPTYYAQAAELPKIIIVSNKMQCYACYEHGNLVRFSAANTGTERKPTLPGRYALNWKARLRKSSLNDEWELPFTWNFHKYAGNAFHQFDMPGRPVSHSCVRQFRDDAQWLFSWGKGWQHDSSGTIVPFSGTPVIIIDIFDYSRKKGGPWLELASNRDSLLSLPDQPLEIEEALIPISQVPNEVRGGLPNRRRYATAEDTLRARGIIRPGVTLSASIDYNKRRQERAIRKAKAEEERKQRESSAITPEGSVE